MLIAKMMMNFCPFSIPREALSSITCPPVCVCKPQVLYRFRLLQVTELVNKMKNSDVILLENGEFCLSYTECQEAAIVV